MRENGKILGVLGGMGPLATQLFYKMIIQMTNAKSDQEHINMIILNHATIPDRTTAILQGNTDLVFEKLLEDVRVLEKAGATCIAIPCNTSHYFMPMLQKEVKLPIINMIEETVKFISHERVARRVGILATDGTIKTELYQKKCKEMCLEPVILCDENQKRVMKIIYKGIKDGGEIDYSDFEKIEQELKERNCDCAIMACTELSCFKEMFSLDEYYVDAMEILTKKVILACGKKVRINK